MRIAIISTSQIPSTTANSIQVMKVCHAYRELGHEVVLIVPGEKKVGWEEISKIFGINKEFTIRYIKTFKFLRRYDFFIISWFILLFNSFHLVHTWLPQVALISGLLKTPYIMELHGLPTGKLGPWFHKKLFFSNHKKQFLIITNALKLLFENSFQFKFNPNEIVIAPNGVSLEPYSENKKVSELRSSLSLNDHFAAVYTGHLYQGRGMKLLIELAKSLPDVHFIWVGGRVEDVNYWRDISEKLELKNLTLTGFVNNEEIPAYQLLGDVLLMPYENIIAGSSGGNSVDFCSPMKMFEYMAAGKPIISSDLPIIHEVLNKKNAIFCPFDDVNQWVKAIERLKEDSELGQKIGNKAKNDVEQYTWIERTKNSLNGFVQ
jgi:glycosyltransferase involved in cell wall biosynthesis